MKNRGASLAVSSLDRKLIVQAGDIPRDPKIVSPSLIGKAIFNRSKPRGIYPGLPIKSWELTDELREVAKDFILQRKRDEGKVYRRKPGAGRKPVPPRRVLEGIFFVLRTGIQWKALPKEYGAAGSIHQYFSEWAEAGFFRRLWQEGLPAYDLVKGLGWEWQSMDGCMVKAPLAREAVGNNPTDRGKKRGASVS